MIRTAVVSFVFTVLSATAPTNTVAPAVTEQSVALAINTARAEVGAEALAARDDSLQESCESRTEEVIASGSPAKAIDGEVIGRAGEGATATEVVANLLSVEEYREALLSTDAQQMGVAVETDEFGYPVVVVKTAAE